MVHGGDVMPMAMWEPRGPHPGRLALADGQLHLWLRAGAAGQAEVASAISILSDDERQRASAFSAEVDRRRYVVAHGCVRHLLADYTGIDAQALRFQVHTGGKPALAAEQARSGIAFNLSHSGDAVLLGVAQGIAVGVDVELMRPLSDLDGLARAIFSPAERRRFDALDASLRTEAFFAAWSRKEAVVKAMGSGLSSELAGVEATIDPREPAALRALNGSSAAARRWSLWGMRSAHGAWLAAAAPRAGMAVRSFALQPDHGGAWAVHLK